MQELFDALAKAQSEFPTIPKDSQVDVYSKPPERKFLYSYKYADLTTIINATRAAFAKNGLSFSQGFDIYGNIFETIIRHKSGQSISAGLIPIKLNPNLDGKEIASTITYLKRVSLTAALGVSADEDVDAAADNGRNGTHTDKAPRYAPPTTKTPDIVEKPLIDQISDLARVKNVTNMQLKEFISKMGKKKSAECTEDELMTIFNWLKMK